MNDEQKKRDEIYHKLQELINDQEVGEAMELFAYTLAEISADFDIPKKEFLALFVELFDSAYVYITNAEKTND